MAIQGLEFDKPTLVDGGHEQKAIVNTASGKQPVNAPTVEDIKRIAKGEAEKAAEEASATEWEKDLKPNLYYQKGRDVIVAEKRIETTGLQLTGDDQAIAFDSTQDAFLYEDYDQTATPLKNLTDGNRVFKHEITIEGRLEGETTGSKFLYIIVYNSSQNGISSLTELEDIVSGAVGMFEGDSYEIAYISYASSTYNSISILGASSGGITMDTVLDISDDVTQC